jgi:hypothetical protein
LTYQLEGTLVLDTLHLEHMLDQQQFAHLNPYLALLLCFRIIFLRHHILPYSETGAGSTQISGPVCLQIKAQDAYGLGF